MKKFSLLMVLIAVLTAVPLFASGNTPHRDKPGNGPGVVGADGIFDLYEELDLTQDQLLKIKQLRSESREKTLNLRHEIHMTFMEQKEEIEKDAPDTKKLDATCDKISESQKALMKLRLNDMLEVKKILTPEQNKKLILLMETKKDAFKKKGFFGKHEDKKTGLK
ncbi:MAG: periplasmic heavy metal sensor [Candidatus Goldbacteria bacterium]|nr:periplasmic heavy metal sensor [Candidatus Goldiibacteriota bacterium]